MLQERIKMLEVNFGKDFEPRRFHLTDVGDDCYVLSRWGQISLQSSFLNDWIQQNVCISEQDYQKMINIRSGLIDDLDEVINSFFFDSNAFFQKSVRIGGEIEHISSDSVSQNMSAVEMGKLDFKSKNNNRLFLQSSVVIKSMMSEEKHSVKNKAYDDQFIGDKNGGLKQWNISRNRLIKNYGKVTSNSICAMTMSLDKRFLIISDNSNQIIKISTKLQKIIKRCRVSESNSTSCIILSQDDKSLFFADFSGDLIQLDAKNFRMVKTYSQIHNKGISALVTAHDNEYIYVASCDGCQKQINFVTKRITKDFFKIFDGGIYSMSITSDNKNLFVSDNKGFLKQICQKEQKIIFSQKVLQGWIFSIKVTSENKYLFISDSYGNLLQFCTETKKIVKDYGQVHQNIIYSIVNTNDDGFLYTSDSKGFMQQFSIDGKMLVSDLGQINNLEITCLQT